MQKSAAQLMRIREERYRSWSLRGSWLLRSGTWCVALALSACSMQLQKDQSAPAIQNECTSDATCGSDGICTQGVCYASVGALDSVTIEVEPDGTAAFGGGLSFLLDETGLSSGDGSRDLQLPEVSRLALGSVIADVTSRLDGCLADPATKTLSAHVDITRADTTPGIAGTASADAELRLGTPLASTAVDGGGAAPDAATSGQWVFAPVRLAPSTYDLLVRPANPTSCDVAPLLLRNVVMPAGDIQLPLALPPPKTIGGTVTPPAGTTLEGWSIDMIEPDHGVTISTTGVLGASSPTNFQLGYRPVQTASVQNNTSGTPQIALSGQLLGVPYLRISPPAGSTAPTLYWNLAAADLDGVGTVALDASGLVITPTLVTGQVTTGASPVAAAITFVSSSIEGAPAGLIASYGTTIQTSNDGTFSVSLLPGSYRCVAFPVTTGMDDWSITEHDWTVQSGDAAPRTFELSSKVVLAGTVVVEGLGSPLANASVTAAPVVAPNGATVLGAANAKSSLSPSAATTSTTSDGHFMLPVDTGSYSLSIQPPERAGFPWYVAPVVSADPSVVSTWPGSSPIDLPLPVAVGGIVTSPQGGVVGGAVVRAYASVAGGAPVKVGETHTQDDGHYQLLLPSRFGP